MAAGTLVLKSLYTCCLLATDTCQSDQGLGYVTLPCCFLGPVLGLWVQLWVGVGVGPGVVLVLGLVPGMKGPGLGAGLGVKS